MITNVQCIFMIGKHTIFLEARNKIDLHQSGSGLFLRVWEEVSAIFIDDLGNIPSIPFMKILEVFSRKEYQADVRNISHIQLLGKNCQLSEQSQTEMFDLIRNNVADIIKPE